MKKQVSKISVAEKIIKVLNKESKTADEIRKELKDSFGFNIKPEDIRINLLYLLRRGKVNRKKDGKNYRYSI